MSAATFEPSRGLVGSFPRADCESNRGFLSLLPFAQNVMEEEAEKIESLGAQDHEEEKSITTTAKE